MSQEFSLALARFASLRAEAEVARHLATAVDGGPAPRRPGRRALRPVPRSERPNRPT